MTITDWQFTFRCFPPHLLVTQLLHVSAQCTFGLDRTFTFLFHNHYGRTRTGFMPRSQPCHAPVADLASGLLQWKAKNASWSILEECRNAFALRYDLDREWLGSRDLRNDQIGSESSLRSVIHGVMKRIKAITRYPQVHLEIEKPIFPTMSVETNW